MPAARLRPSWPDAWPEGWAAARVLVVVAHPDDEVLGCGGVLGELRDVRVVHVTDGAPREGCDAARHGFADPAQYAAARRAEAEAALAIGGVAASRLTGLGVADQTAPAHLAAITEALVPLLGQADLVLTHAYEGGHGDHDAAAFAVQAAAELLAAHRPAALVEMPFYHADAEGWVRQRFPPGGAADVVRSLGPAERDRKAWMIAAHGSQARTLAGFALDVERFRLASRTDFEVRPHAGPLLYERHGWGLTWPGWQAAVVAARATLGLPAA